MTAVIDVLGWAGAGSLLLAYALLARGRITAGAVYHLMNLGGAFGLAINGAAHRAWPSAALNVLWLSIGVGALYQAGRRRHRSSPVAAPEARPPVTSGR